MKEFLETLFGGADENLYTYLWTMPDKLTYSFRVTELEVMASKAKELDALGRDVYFGVSLTASPCGKHERAKAGDVVAVPAIWVDIDCKTGVHASQNLPPDIETALAPVIEIGDATYVIATGGGCHVYIVFKEPLDPNEGSDVLRRYQGFMQERFAARGWHLDNTADLPRVLRMPGTHNHKNSSKAHAVRVYAAQSGKRYNYEDFDFLPAVREIQRSDGKRREGGFIAKDSDGTVSYLTANCRFIQYFLARYKELPEPIWKAAGSNIVRAAGGDAVIVELVQAWQGENFDPVETQKKIDHWKQDCHPETCAYIHELGFRECTNCPGVKSPCAWATGYVGRAVAQIRATAAPTEELLSNTEFIKNLNITRNVDPETYARFYEACTGRVNKNDLKAAMKQARIETAQAAMEAAEAGTTAVMEDSPISLKIPQGFSFGEDGVHESKLNPQGMPITYLASSSPLLITRQVRNIDNETLKTEIAFKRGGKWQRAIVERSTLLAARGIVSLSDLGLMVSSETAKHAVRYLLMLESLNRDIIPEVKSVSTIGWRPKGCETFVMPNSKDYIVDIADNGEVTGAFTQAGELAAWLEKAEEVRRSPFARFFLAAAFATVLLKPLKARNFVIYLWGQSGGGKTAALHMAMSVWGNPARLMKSFLATANGLERAAEYSNDFPLAINERQVASGAMGKQEALESLVYTIEGGRGKIRASRSGIRRTATWRTIAMATGEEPLSQDTSVQGVKTRLIELHAAPVLEDRLAQELYGFTAETHGTAGIEFLKRLQEEGFEKIRSDFKKLNERLVELYPDNFAPHIANVSLVAIADLYASLWLFGMDEEEAARAAFALACTTLDGMQTRKDIEDAPRVLAFVRDWVEANKYHFDGCPNNPDRIPVSPEYGFVDEVGDIYIYPTVLRRALKEEGFPPTKAMRDLAEGGSIETCMDGKERSFSITKRRGKKLVRTIHLFSMAI